MNPEAWIDMGPLGAPVLEPGPPPIEAEFAYTKQQRAWWLRVYNDTCHFPIYTEEYGFTICGVEHIDQEVHHILPSAFIIAQTPWLDPNSLEATMGILIGKFHHQHNIHPDIGRAFGEYWKLKPDERKDLIKETIAVHKEKASKGIIFWNPDYDVVMRQIAEQRVGEYLLKNPLDHYPKDKRWSKGKHPKKPHWGDPVL